MKQWHIVNGKIVILYEKEWEYIPGLDKDNKQIENSNLNYGKNYDCNSTISVLQENKNNLGIMVYLEIVGNGV